MDGMFPKTETLNILYLIALIPKMLSNQQSNFPECLRTHMGETTTSMNQLLEPVGPFSSNILGMTVSPCSASTPHIQYCRFSASSPTMLYVF